MEKQRIRIDWITAAPLARRCKLRDGKVEVIVSSAGIAGIADIRDHFAAAQLFSLLDALSVALVIAGLMLETVFLMLSRALRVPHLVASLEPAAINLIQMD